MTNHIKLWYDAESDFLEVQFSTEPGYEKETAHDSVMERVNADGKLIGFTVLGSSKFTKDKPLNADLTAA